MAMAVTIFSNDRAYMRWLNEHPDGFVLNTTQPPSARYIVLHRAKCLHISVPSHENEPGGFTERAYAKIGGDDVASLREWAASNGGSFTSECSHCGPTG